MQLSDSHALYAQKNLFGAKLVTAMLMSLQNATTTNSKAVIEKNTVND